MTLPAATSLQYSRTEDRPPKRRKRETSESSKNDASESLVRKHPLRVRPSGNALTARTNLKDACGRFALLPDELLMQFLETLQVPHLLRLGSTCKALHAFTRSEESWRTLFVESQPISFKWRGTWRSTYLSQPSSNEPKIDCSNLYSDVLHRPFYCAHVSLEQYTTNIPARNAIARLADLTQEDFTAKWFDKPFILTEPVKSWPVYKSWSIRHLLERYPDVKFRAESVDWPLSTYVEYMHNNHDESPLYLFDRAFAEKMNLNVSNEPSAEADYWPPPCFGSDIFSVLGDQRPDHRWLIIGPSRSGSTFHLDPNSTSAWNAVLRGSKYWIMFPSSANIPPPPGVYVSSDQSEVTSPLSIAEWMLGFHEEARNTPGCVEAIHQAGEVLHVPSGWYHLVLNLEPSIAITQNFVPEARVGAVLHFLHNQKQSISGFSEDVEDPFALFTERLGRSNPHLLERGLTEMERLSKGVKGKWELLTKGGGDEEEEAEGFSFGFGDNDDDDDEVA